MKLLSIAIPCYNSAAYMRKCIESLLPGGEQVEIIIVDDGSKDETEAIADDYASKYPTIVKAIHQENGGHGEAVNTGLRHATGVYYKVVDSDDWVDGEAYKKILETLENLVTGSRTVDMLISNFVYEKQGARRKKVMSYRVCFPQEEIFTWDDTRVMKNAYILMHSVIYRTRLLKDCGLQLPSHTFYVDNIFVFQPLPSVKTLYYVNVNFYRYFIGREDQSVNEAVMIRRIDQQIKVNKIMIEILTSSRVENKKLKKYMVHYLDIITLVSTMMLIRSGTEVNLEKKNDLWQYLKKKDFALYYRIRFGLLGRYTHIPGKGGRQVMIVAYRLVRKFYGFN